MRQTACLIALLATAPALAADYTAAEGSTLGFGATYMGEAFEGSFPRFTAAVSFDPAAPAACRFDVVVTLAGADTGVPERDEMLQAGEFFDSARAPTASWKASSCKALPDGRYEAAGTLTLRGISKPVPLRFAWTPGPQPQLRGDATVDRLAFNVGTGDWTDTELLPAAVTVTTTLRLR